MSNNLAYVLAKVQFGRITDSKFKEASDTIKEELRKEYPVLSSTNEVRMMEIKVTPHGQEANETRIPLITLTSASKDWGVRISPDNLFLHTNSYTSFEEFTQRMHRLLDVAGRILSIYHTAFVGIRYINKFAVDDKGNFDSYFRRKEFLQPSLAGLDMAGSNLLSRYKTDIGWLNVNSGVLVGEGKLPNEILELAADLGEKIEILNGAWAHLDIDSFTAQKGMIDYDLDRVMEQLAKLRHNAKSVYSQIINDV